MKTRVFEDIVSYNVLCLFNIVNIECVGQQKDKIHHFSEHLHHIVCMQ